ncbi:MAG: aminotransferase class IV [Cytophagales bacterium]|nr:aminotransferase class IV [Cytophagales bacterium]
MSRWFYVNGEFVQEEQAVLPLTQTGFQRAYGIFDHFRADQGRPRFMRDYLDRFDQSQKFLNLTHEISITEIEAAVTELQVRNQFEFSTYKLVLMGDGPDTSDTLFEPFFYIINKPINPDQLPTETGMITHEYLRELPKVKSLNYLNSYALHRKRVAAKAGEVLYHLNGQVSEASRSNVYVIRDGQLITAADNILHGVTRKHVLKIAEDILPVEVGTLRINDLLDADEIFLTSTLKEVMPVTFVDDQKFSKTGHFTNKIKTAFKEYTIGQLQA